jgi:hypothetical protein
LLELRSPHSPDLPAGAEMRAILPIPHFLQKWENVRAYSWRERTRNEFL